MALVVIVYDAPKGARPMSTTVDAAVATCSLNSRILLDMVRTSCVVNAADAGAKSWPTSY